MSTQQNREIVARAREEFWNAGRLEIASELFGSDFVNHDPTRPDIQTLQQLIDYARELRIAFADFQVHHLDDVAEGDKVAARWEVTGKHQAQFAGVPATGKMLTTQGMTFYRLSGGKIAELWWTVDHLGTMRELGAIPEGAHA
jgi:steroid delta-isomerase-like uncharacterized protein